MPIGAPWKHCLEITDLQAGKLDASSSLVGAKWIWPTVVISAAIAALITCGSFNAFGEGNIATGAASALFACLAFVVAIFAVGCASYTVRLKVEGDTVTFGQKFFWITKGGKELKQALGYLRCWSHSTGSGSNPSYHVCLHPLLPLPVMSLFSIEYLPDIRRKAGELMGMDMDTDMLSNEEAFSLVAEKASEIAACLDIENKTESNN